MDFGMFWIDIEERDYYKNNCPANKKMVEQIVDETIKQLPDGKKRIGIYASKHMWDMLLCDWDGLKEYPLWYPHYDKKPDYSDFVPFGGWKKPVMKQYFNSHDICGTVIDSDVIV